MTPATALAMQLLATAEFPPRADQPDRFARRLELFFARSLLASLTAGGKNDG